MASSNNINFARQTGDMHDIFPSNLILIITTIETTTFLHLLHFCLYDLTCLHVYVCILTERVNRVNRKVLSERTNLP